MIDDVFDSAVEKKSPLILNHMSLSEAIADGGCVGGYYDCNGRGALEQVVTRDSYMNNDEEEETEPRDPPPNPGPVSFGPDAPPMAHQDIVYDDVVPPNFTFAQQACAPLGKNAPLGKSAALGKKQQSKKMDAIVQSNHTLAQQACAPLGKTALLEKKQKSEKSEKPELEKPKDDVVVLTPPKQTFAQRACASLGKTQTRKAERKEGEKNLLAKARGDTASSSATTMLEASKQQTFENQPVPSSQAKKKKATNNKPCPIEIPIYARQTVGRKASPESSKTDDVDAVRAEAAAKWRMAKAKKNKIHGSISEEEEGKGDRYTPKHGNDAEREDVPQEDVVVVSDAAPQVEESDKKESDQNDVEKETPSTPECPTPKTDYYDLAARIAKDVAETPRQQPQTTQDPPDSFVDEIEDDDVLSVFVESLKRSLNGHANGDSASFQSGESTLPSNPSGGDDDKPSSKPRQVNLQPPEEGTAMFFHKHAMALQHLEDQQTANRSKLFEQRLRHQRLKTHRTKQHQRAALPTVSLVSPSSSSLRSTNSRDPTGTVLGGEEEQSASTMVVQSFHVSL